MNLLIHDLSPQQFSKISEDYQDWTVISDNGKIQPCLGCFCCWHKTPGECIRKDGYENMGALVHYARKVTIISRYTYGGVSGFIKNVFDRCLGYVLPQFEVVNGESHHQKRYDDDKPFTFIFYGNGISEQEKAEATRYANAVCANFRCHVREVIFQETDEPNRIPDITPVEESGRTVFINGSLRYEKGNSATFAKMLAKSLNTEPEVIALRKHLNDLSGLTASLKDASTIVFCLPLNVDGLPSQVIRLLETFRKEYSGPSKRIYVLANMGLYESQQLVNLFTAVRQWSSKMGFEYCGGLGISAGEMIGILVQQLPLGFWPTNKIVRGLNTLADAINNKAIIEDIYAEPYMFPRSLYLGIANRNWNNLACKNGISPKDLYRKL